MTEKMFNPLIDGYLSYLLEVKRLTRETVRDIRCTLKKTTEYMYTQSREMELWQVGLNEYMNWIGYERDRGKTTISINKQICHLRGFLEYAWRNGRTDRNVLDGFTLQDNDAKIQDCCLHYRSGSYTPPLEYCFHPMRAPGMYRIHAPELKKDLL